MICSPKLEGGEHDVYRRIDTKSDEEQKECEDSPALDLRDAKEEKSSMMSSNANAKKTTILRHSYLEPPSIH